MRTTKKMLFNEKTLNILMSLNNSSKKKTVTYLAKETNAVYCHTSNVVSMLEDDGLVEKTRYGRTVFIELTEKGKLITCELSKLVKLF